MIGKLVPCVLAVLALAVSACGSDGSVAESSTGLPAASTVAPATTTTPSTTSPLAPATTTSVPATTTAPETTQPADVVVDRPLPVDARYLVYGPDGIIALTDAGELIRVSTDPTAIAIGIGPSLIVSQGGTDGGSVRLRRTGPIIVHEPTGIQTLPGPADEELRLYDAGIIDGQAVIVATTLMGGGHDTDERLLLIDIATGERTDLGTVGYYEATVEEAKLAGELIIVKPFGQEHLIEALALDGTSVWAVDGPNDFEHPGHVVVTGDAVLVVNPGFEGDDFSPVLEIVAYDASNGEQVSIETLALDAEFGGGFCLIPDWDGARLVCEESYGGPFAVDIEAGSVTRLTALERGTVSTIRALTP